MSTPGAATPTRTANRTPCSTCGRTWTGARTAHCGGCHKTFAGLTMFDEHRSGGTCHHPKSAVRQVGGVWRGEERDMELTLNLGEAL